MKVRWDGMYSSNEKEDEPGKVRIKRTEDVKSR